MKHRKKLAAAAMTVLMAALMAMPAMAASRKKISSVNLEIEADVQPDTRYGEETIEVDTKGGKYSFDYYEIENTGFEWTREDIPQIVIYLRADEGYYFSVSKASSVKLSGATYIKASKQDSSEILKLTVKLPPLAESVGDLTEVVLTDNGYGMWDAVPGAATYEFRLYRNGEGIGVTMLSTTGTDYNFKDIMDRPGSYQIKIRPVNGLNVSNKGEWMESNIVNLSKEQAAAIRNGEAGSRPLRGAWKSNAQGSWYELEDGSYPMNQWMELEGQWYFFDENGYMKTGWIEWNGKKYYCNKAGVMQKNTTTPDGYILDENGTLKND